MASMVKLFSKWHFGRASPEAVGEARGEAMPNALFIVNPTQPELTSHPKDTYLRTRPTKHV